MGRTIKPCLEWTETIRYREGGGKSCKLYTHEFTYYVCSSCTSLVGSNRITYETCLMFLLKYVAFKCVSSLSVDTCCTREDAVGKQGCCCFVFFLQMTWIKRTSKCPLTTPSLLWLREEQVQIQGWILVGGFFFKCLTSMCDTISKAMSNSGKITTSTES